MASLLNFASANSDYIDFLGLYSFAGEFYVEIDFEYSGVTSTYAGVMGRVGFRILVSPTTTIINIGANQFSKAYATSYNTRYVIRVRRDASNNILLSYNGGTEYNLGVSTQTATPSVVSFADTVPRYLQGKVYRYDVNGDEYLLTEGSGDIVNGSLGGEGTIMTSNVGGITYINDTMWEAL